MTCLEAQGKITLFINNEMDYDEMEKFLEHIDTCEYCKEELEVYYILLTGMKQLNEDKALSNDLHTDFLRKLESSKDNIINKKLDIIKKKILFAILIVLFTVITSVTLDIKETKPIKEIQVSSFSLGETFYKKYGKRYSIINNRFIKNINKIYADYNMSELIKEYLYLNDIPER